MSLELLWAALLTVAVETVFFAVTYRRDAAFLVLCAALNIATNLALNLLLSCLPQGELYWLIYPLELAVVAIEYAVYAYACGRLEEALFADPGRERPELLHRTRVIRPCLRKEET